LNKTRYLYYSLLSGNSSLVLFSISAGCANLSAGKQVQLFHVDSDGFYWYEGRTDDMIRVGGEWASPIEIENTLLEHACVKEAAVVGVPVEGITRIKAVIALLPGNDITHAELVVQLQEMVQRKVRALSISTFDRFC
jgi:acyl-coenzyme A synthetase/AMP-(fatty) acid ligase